MGDAVYLDHNATTPLAPGVLEQMLPWLQHPSNPSSRHAYGRAALAALTLARQQVAAALGAAPGEVIFTSGGTEAANMLLKGLFESRAPGGLAVSMIEHPCVVEPVRQMARQQGVATQWIPVDGRGQVALEAYQMLLESRPALVAVMMANNETGVMQEIPRLAGLARAQGARFVTDAVQAFGKVPVNFRALNASGVNALWVSAHKIGGPKGVGALVLDKRLDVEPLLAGGGQERNLRSGTENLAAIVGFGWACERFANQGVVDGGVNPELIARCRQRLEAGLFELGAEIFGQAATRLPNTSFFAFEGIDGETLVGKLDEIGFAVASGSACSSAKPEPSHVLRAMGVDPLLSRCAVRVSLGAGNTLEEIERFLVELGRTVHQLRSLTALNAELKPQV